MARLREKPRKDEDEENSDDSLPDLGTLLKKSTIVSSTARSRAQINYGQDDASGNHDDMKVIKPKMTPSRRQRVLKPISGNADLLQKRAPGSQLSPIEALAEQFGSLDILSETPKRERTPIPKRIVSQRARRIIESDSESDAEFKVTKSKPQQVSSDDDDQSPSKPQRRHPLPEVTPEVEEVAVIQRPPTPSELDLNPAILRFSPPRNRSPRKAAPATFHRPRTPSPGGSVPKARLTSPSKSKRIPTPPDNRPSLDAFWSAEVINEWNDAYSPRKVLSSPKKRLGEPILSSLRHVSISDSEDSNASFHSPPTSPRKGKTLAVKKDRSAAEAKKAFEARKQGVAEQFLRELDDRITGGKVGELAESCGGVKLVWSKKLNSTAGRANSRRETIRTKDETGVVVTTYRHHASIELAEKVIDDEERLINVIAHEYCHLANFMISGIKNNPHGKEFKEWARKTTAAFSHRNVEVTTKHTYDISYKYHWTCTECGHVYKRHSKSIDPTRHTCGACRSPLMQTKPTVRAAQGKSEYQTFVKENFRKVKEELAAGSGGSANHGAVMETLGRRYRELKLEKENRKSQSSTGNSLNHEDDGDVVDNGEIKV